MKRPIVQNIILLENIVEKKGLKKEVFVEYIKNSEDGLDALKKIKSYIKINEFFAEGIINLFFEGSTAPILRRVLALFEFKKLDINKFNFSLDSLIDTIVRYKVKGSYSASKENNPEAIIEKVLKELNKTKPKIIIECSIV